MTINQTIEKNKKVSIIIGAVIIAVIFFGAGTAYGKGGLRNGGNERVGMANGMMNGEGMARGQNGQMPGGQGMGGNSANRIVRTAGGFVAGEILSNDGSTMTIKLKDGGSKIVFLATSTAVMKNSPADKSALQTGAAVIVTGTPNQDGSINASNISLTN